MQFTPKNKRERQVIKLHGSEWKIIREKDSKVLITPINDIDHQKNWRWILK